VNYDFSTHPSFSTLSTGTSDAELIYTISFSPYAPDFFETGATAFVSFLRVQLYEFGNHDFDYDIISITSTTITLKIRKYGNTGITALKGQILVVANDAAGNYNIFINNNLFIASLGFASTKITQTSIFGPGLGAVSLSGPVTSISGYYGRPEMLFFPRRYKFNTNSFSFKAEGDLSVSSGNFVVNMLATQSTSSQMAGFEFDVLLFCDNGKDCITPQTAPLFDAGESNIRAFHGTPLATATASPRTFLLNIAFKRFFSTTPAYSAAGLQGADAPQSFSFSVSAVTQYGMTIEVKALANQVLNLAVISYVVSNWGIFSNYNLKI